MSYLIARGDDGRDITVPLREKVEIGRMDQDWTVVARARDDTFYLGISDATVSKAHALIYVESGKLMLKDLGSKNGTLLNSHRMPGWRPGAESEPVEIKDSSSVQFGLNTVVRVVLVERTLRQEEWEGIR